LAICPSCQNQIDIGSEFFGGLFTCPLCRSVYFIGFDGIPESAANQEPKVPEPPPIIPENLPQMPEENFPNLMPIDNLNYQPEPEANDQSYQVPPIEDYLATTTEEADQQVDPLVTYKPPAVDEAAPPVFSPLQDVVDFANSEGAATLAAYSVEIKKLDSQVVIQDFMDVMTDSKLQINFEELKSQIIGGTLKLDKLTAAQAAVIAFRLRPLNIEMKWEQII
jgi:hypothetical protein